MNSPEKSKDIYMSSLLIGHTYGTYLKVDPERRIFVPRNDASDISAWNRKLGEIQATHNLADHEVAEIEDRIGQGLIKLATKKPAITDNTCGKSLQAHRIPYSINPMTRAEFSIPVQEYDESTKTGGELRILFTNLDKLLQDHSEQPAAPTEGWLAKIGRGLANAALRFNTTRRYGNW